MMEDHFILRSPFAESQLSNQQEGSKNPEISAFVDPGTFSLSFQDSLGKESLGILPPNFGRDSLGFLDTSMDNPFRDSLGFKSILQLSSYGRESLDCGRESLGILQLNSLDVRFGEDDTKLPDIMLSTINESANESVCAILDTAFLFPSPRKTAISSTSSHNSGNPSFNSCSLEEPSRIYTLSSSKNDTQFDKVFSTTSSGSLQSVLNKGKIISPSELESHLRIQSLPDSHALGMDPMDRFWRMHKAKNDSCLVNGSFHVMLSFDDEKDNKFHDSLFIEGNFIADKLADGSILDDSFGDEIGNLDNIPPPQWPEPCISPAKETEVSETAVEIEEKPESDSKTAFKFDNTPNKSKNAKDILHNLSEILNSTNHSDQQRSEGQHLLSSLAELLCDKSSVRSSNLDDSGRSSINEQTDSSEKLHHECYEVLDFSKKSTSLTENVLDLSVKSKSTDLNLNKRITQSFSCPNANSKVNITDMLRKSVSGLTSDTSKNNTAGSNSSAKSGSLSTGNIMVPSLRSKLKVKAGGKVAKKGPLKAVIPVKDMKKQAANLGTPEKSYNSMIQSKKTSTPISEPSLKPVAASTPTPQSAKDEINSAIKKSTKSFQSSVSKIATTTRGTVSATKPLREQKITSSVPTNNRYSIRSANTTKDNNQCLKEETVLGGHPVKSTGDKQNPSLQTKPSTSDKQHPPMLHTKSFTQVNCKEQRKHSIHELKTVDIQGRKRSNSLNKEATGIMSSMSKIRHSLVNSPEYKELKSKSLLKENNNNVGTGSKAKVGLNKHSSSSSEFKPTKLLPKLKKAGKENVAK